MTNDYPDPITFVFYVGVLWSLRILINKKEKTS